MQLSDHVIHPTRSMLPVPLLPLSSCALFPPPPPHITHPVCSSTSYVAGFSCPVYPSSEREGAKHRIQGSHPLVLGLDGRGEGWMEREGARERGEGEAGRECGRKRGGRERGSEEGRVGGRKGEGGI